MNLQKKKNELKLKSVEDLEGALQDLKTQISFTSNLFNDCILLVGRFKDVKDAFLKDTVARFERNIELAKIRGALLDLIDKLTSEDFDTIGKSIEKIYEEEGEELEDELGFYDYLEIAENGFKESTESITKLGGFTTEFGSKITKQVEKITRLNNSGSSGQSKTILVKKILKDTSEYFDIYNSQMEGEIPTFKDVSGRSLDAYYKTVEFLYSNSLQNENEDELKNVYRAVISLDESCGTARVGMMKLYSAVKQLPQMQKEFNKSKRITEKQLELLFQELENYRSKIREFKDYLELNLKQIE
jgi:hypothetical protein